MWLIIRGIVNKDEKNPRRSVDFHLQQKRIKR